MQYAPGSPVRGDDADVVQRGPRGEHSRLSGAQHEHPAGDGVEAERHEAVLQPWNLTLSGAAHHLHSALANVPHAVQTPLALAAAEGRYRQLPAESDASVRG